MLPVLPQAADVLAVCERLPLVSLRCRLLSGDAGGSGAAASSAPAAHAGNGVHVPGDAPVTEPAGTSTKQQEQDQGQAQAQAQAQDSSRALGWDATAAVREAADENKAQKKAGAPDDPGGGDGGGDGEAGGPPAGEHVVEVSLTRAAGRGGRGAPRAYAPLYPKASRGGCLSVQVELRVWSLRVEAALSVTCVLSLVVH